MNPTILICPNILMSLCPRVVISVTLIDVGLFFRAAFPVSALSSLLLTFLFYVGKIKKKIYTCEKEK